MGRAGGRLFGALCLGPTERRAPCALFLSSVCRSTGCSPDSLCLPPAPPLARARLLRGGGRCCYAGMRRQDGTLCFTDEYCWYHKGCVANTTAAIPALKAAYADMPAGALALALPFNLSAVRLDSYQTTVRPVASAGHGSCPLPERATHRPHRWAAGVPHLPPVHAHPRARSNPCLLHRLPFLRRRFHPCRLPSLPPPLQRAPSPCVSRTRMR